MSPIVYVDKKMRKGPYTFADYLMDFDTWRKQIYPLLPTGTRLLGPSWAYPASLKDAAAFLDAERPYLLALSQHYYVGNACNGNTNPADTLLRPRNSTDASARMQNAVSIAHAQHVGFRVDEVNSIACGGEDGVSNTFGSALWAIDIMFEFARAGVDGINWQTPNGAAYSFLSFNISHQGAHRIYRIKTIAPLYYGLLFFQAATGNHARAVASCPPYERQHQSLGYARCRWQSARGPDQQRQPSGDDQFDPARLPVCLCVASTRIFHRSQGGGCISPAKHWTAALMERCRARDRLRPSSPNAPSFRSRSPATVHCLPNAIGELGEQ